MPASFFMIMLLTILSIVVMVLLKPRRLERRWPYRTIVELFADNIVPGEIEPDRDRERDRERRRRRHSDTSSKLPPSISGASSLLDTSVDTSVLDTSANPSVLD